MYDFRLGAEEGDPTIRQRYEQEAAVIGKEALWQKLQAVDPLAAAKIHYNNERKVIRALEVLKRLAKVSLHQKRHHKLCTISS